MQTGQNVLRLSWLRTRAQHTDTRGVSARVSTMCMCRGAERMLVGCLGLDASAGLL